MESGEYTGNAIAFIPMDSAVFGTSLIHDQLEKIDYEQTWTSPARKDWLETYYDYTDDSADGLTSFSWDRSMYSRTFVAQYRGHATQT